MNNYNVPTAQVAAMPIFLFSILFTVDVYAMPYMYVFSVYSTPVDGLLAETGRVFKLYKLCESVTIRFYLNENGS